MSNDSDADLLWLLRLMRQHPHDAEVFAAIDNHLSTNNWECPVPLGELFSQSSTSSSSSSLTGLAKTVADRLLLHQQPAVVEWLLTKSQPLLGELGRDEEQTAVLVYYSARYQRLKSLHDLLLLAYDAETFPVFSERLLSLIEHEWLAGGGGLFDRLLQLVCVEAVEQLYSLSVEDCLGKNVPEQQYVRSLPLTAVYYKALQSAAEQTPALIISRLYEERIMAARILALLAWNSPLPPASISRLIERLQRLDPLLDPLAPLLAGSLMAAVDFLASSCSTKSAVSAAAAGLASAPSSPVLSTTPSRPIIGLFANSSALDSIWKQLNATGKFISEEMRQAQLLFCCLVNPQLSHQQLEEQVDGCLAAGALQFLSSCWFLPFQHLATFAQPAAISPSINQQQPQPPQSAPLSATVNSKPSLLQLAEQQQGGPESGEDHKTWFGVFLADQEDYAKLLLLSLGRRLIGQLLTRCMDLLRRLKIRDEDALLVKFPPLQPQLHHHQQQRQQLGNGSQSAYLFSKSTLLIHNGTEAESAEADRQMKQLEKERLRRWDFTRFLQLVAAVYRDRPNQAQELLDGRRRGFLKLLYDDRMSIPAKCAYWDMLASLACGERCAGQMFEILASSYYSSSVTAAAGGSQTTGGSPLSWDWLFGAVDWYTQAYQRSAEQGQLAELSGDDLLIMQSILRLLRTVVSYSLPARNQLVDLLDALRRLFQLLCHRVPNELKAALFETLAAFCQPHTVSHLSQTKDAECCAIVWQLMEQIQVLPGTAAAGSAGVIYDLEMIESKDEQYPETLAFLRLLNVLLSRGGSILLDPLSSSSSSSSLLLTSAAGSAISTDMPAMWRYSTFVIENCLLRLHQRGFRRPAERWQLIAECLRFTLICLQDFRLTDWLLQSANDGKVLTGVFAHPGTWLTVNLLSGQQLFHALCEVVTHRDQPSARSAVELALLVMRQLLAVQDRFLYDFIPRLRRSTSAAAAATEQQLHRWCLLYLPAHKQQQLSAVDELLSRQPNFLIQLADVVNYDSHSSSHQETPGQDGSGENICLLAIRLLHALAKTRSLSSSASAASLLNNSDLIESLNNYAPPSTGADEIGRLVRIIGQSAQCKRIIGGFVQRLLNDEGDGDDEIRLAIVEMMLDTVGGDGGLSLAHLLLGFNVSGGATGVQSTVFKQPGPAVQKTCLYALLDILNDSCGSDSALMASRLPVYQRHPRLVKRIHQLLFTLCSQPATASATIRYLRYGCDYFHRQLVTLLTDGDVADINATAAASDDFESVQLSIRAWVLKMLALEMHVSALHNERRHGVRLMLALFGLDRSLQSGDDENYPVANRLLDLLASSQILTHPGPPKLRLLKQFPLNNLPVAISTLPVDTATDEGGDHRIIDLRKTSDLIAKWLAANRLPMDAEVTGEMEALIAWLAENNRQIEHQSAISALLEGWCQLVEVSLNFLYADLPAGSQLNLLLSLSAALLGRLQPLEASSAASLQSAKDQMSAVRALLVVYSRLRQEYLGTASEDTVDGLQELFTQFSSQLIHSLLDKSASRTPAVRGNLYAVLLNHLQIISSRSPRPSQASPSPPSANNDSLRHQVDLFIRFLDPLLTVVCQDATADGEHQVWRTVALYLLESLIACAERAGSSEGVGSILTFLRRRNYVRHLIAELKSRDDQALTIMLQKEPELLTDLYVYEAKMALFARLSQTIGGAESLLESRLLESLSDCRFPSSAGSGAERRDSIQFPIFSLIASLLSTTDGTKNHGTAIKKVSGFMSAHSSMIVRVLSDQSGSVSVSSLEKLNHLTRIYYYIVASTTTGGRGGGEIDGAGDFGRPAVLRLMSKYLSFENWINQLRPITSSELDMLNTPIDQLLGAVSFQSLAQRYPMLGTAFGLQCSRLVESLLRNLFGCCQRMACVGSPLFSTGITSTAGVEQRPLSGAQEQRSVSDTPSLTSLLAYLKALVQQISSVASAYQTTGESRLSLPQSSAEALIDSKRQFTTMLASMEIILYLIYWHLEAGEWRGLSEDLQAELTAECEQLQSQLILPKEFLGKLEYRQRRNYITLLTVRTRDKLLAKRILNQTL